MKIKEAMRNRPLFTVCLSLFLFLAVMISIGGARFVKELRTSNIETYVEDGARLYITGEVYQKEVRKDYQILYLKENSITYRKQSFRESKLIIYDEEKLKVNIGNKIIARGSCTLFEEERNPGNFNQKLYYQKLDIHASVWADTVEVLSDDTNPVMDQLFLFRTLWKEKLYEILGEEDGSVLAAMLLGEKGDMDAETKNLYQANGIGHILSISGLHISFIGIGIYQILRRLTGSYVVGGFMGIVFLLLYILMIGFTVSAVRAVVMFLFRVGADMTGRHYDGLTALMMAAVICLIWRPLYLYDGGFWMSFGAILGMIVVLPVFKELPVQAFWASIGINLFLLPIQLYYFFEFPTYSLILNLWVIPLTSVLMFCGMLGSGMAVVVGTVGEIVLRFCKVIFRIYEKSCEAAMELPGARMVMGKPELWQVVGYYVVLACVLGWIYCRKEQKRKIKECDRQKEKKKTVKAGKEIYALALSFSIGVIILTAPFTDYRKLKVTMIDVGQGDSIFIQSPKGSTYLIDGGSSDVNKVGQYRLESFLKSQGVGKLDYVFVTHGDEDHINGISEIIERSNVGIEIETIVFPNLGVWDEKLLKLADKAQKSGVKTVTIKGGQKLTSGDMIITCLGPNKGSQGEDGNAASMVLSLSCQGFDILLTGDVEAEGEVRLCEKLKEEYQEISWEVLKVAHHGSKNSTGEEFLNIVKPQYALVSAGRGNRYGHPHEETVERLKESESKILSTQECGAVTFTVEFDSKVQYTYERYIYEEE